MLSGINATVSITELIVVAYNGYGEYHYSFAEFLLFELPLLSSSSASASTVLILAPEGLAIELFNVMSQSRE